MGPEFGRINLNLYYFLLSFCMNRLLNTTSWQVEDVVTFQAGDVQGDCLFLDRGDDFGVYFLSGAWFRSNYPLHNWRLSFILVYSLGRARM